ncbi:MULTISPECIES: cation:proton antiporter [unclassified Streptomyces]|uniref:cation:proton antiporter n=1 Tax=unclassified Streptomyces TaxID=2593676 RepID=UPI00331C2414
MIVLLVVMALVFLWALVSDRLARWSITAPIAFVLAGAVLAGGDHPVLRLDFETDAFRRSVELVLAVMLFADATEARSYERLENPTVEHRLLGLALPASVGLATLLGAALFPGTGWWLLVVAALVVMPMDLAPVLNFLKDERVPWRVRAALNIEGGFNDGLISPLFVFAVANAVGHGDDSFADLVLNALQGAVLAVLVGTALGLGASWLVRRSHRAGWAEPRVLRLAGLALPFLAYAGAVLIGGNGFVAAFVTGMCYARTAHDVGRDHLDLVHDASQLMAIGAWFAFGKLVADEFSHGIELSVVAYGFLALTAARYVPVVLSLTGTDFTRAERNVMGWLGPRGVTSIVFAVLAYVELGARDASLILKLAGSTVLLSVILHGVTAEPLARWLGQRAVIADGDEGSRTGHA